MLVIEIAEATCGTNELVRDYRNQHKRGRERDRWHWLVAEKLGRGFTAPIECCEITITRRSGNPMDWDNMGGGLKFLLDALVSNGILADDKPAVVTRLNLQQEVTRKLLPATIVEIVPLIDH